MPDIFGRRSQVYGGAYTADSIVLNFGNLVQLGLLVQKIQLAYTQPINLIYEILPALTTNVNVYLHAGRQEGEFILVRLIGPTAITNTFYTTYGNPCNNNPISIVMQSGCNTGAFSQTVRYTMTGAALYNTLIEGNAKEGIYSEILRGKFINLEFTPT